MPIVNHTLLIHVKSLKQVGYQHALQRPNRSFPSRPHNNLDLYPQFREGRTKTTPTLWSTSTRQAKICQRSQIATWHVMYNMSCWNQLSSYEINRFSGSHVTWQKRKNNHPWIILSYTSPLSECHVWGCDTSRSKNRWAAKQHPSCHNKSNDKQNTSMIQNIFYFSLRSLVRSLTFPRGNFLRNSGVLLVSPKTNPGATWTLPPPYWAAMRAL